MIRPYAGTGLAMRHSKRPPVDCAVCTKPIENPGPFQKVHPGACHREWNNRNSAKHHAKRKAAKLAKRARKKIGKISGRKPIKDPAYLDFIRSRACIICAFAEQRWNQHRTMRERITAAGVDFTDHTPIGNSPKPQQLTPTEAAHVGLRGLRQKCSDRETLPLCAEHHRTGPDSHHVLGKRFWEHHGIDRDIWVAAYAEAQRRDAA